MHGGEEDPLDRLAAIFRSSYSPMVRVAQLILDDRAAAEDAVQESFARLHSKLDGLEDPGAAEAYLRVMVVNQARSTWRRRALAFRHNAQLGREDAAWPDPGVEDLAAHAEVLQALRAISRRQRECLVLRYYLDLPEAEVAATLRIGVGSVKTHTARGLAAMAKLLGETG